MFYVATLEPIINYPDLTTDVFQVFREMGNGLLLLRAFDSLVRQKR